MLDMLGIFFSTMAALFVVWRAAKLDERYPWFDPPGPEADAEPSNDATWRAEALRGERQFR